MAGSSVVSLSIQIVIKKYWDWSIKKNCQGEDKESVMIHETTTISL